MLFHVTISHRQADCPGRRPAETPDLIGPAERLEALGDEFSVTSHSLVWGASCILWAEPEHVAYALLEAPSLEAVELYIDALTPAGWETRALPVFTVPGQLDTVRQVLSQPVIPHVRPPAVVAEPVAEAEPAPEAKPAARAEAAAVAEPALEVDFADEDDTLKGLTFAQLPDVPPDTTPEPREQERPDQQVTRAMPTPVVEPSVAQAAERPDQQITREIPQPVVPAAEPPDQQITREIPQPVVPAAEPPDQQITRAIPVPVAPPAEPADKQTTREIPQPVVPPAEPADKQVTREIPQPVAQSDRGSSPSSSAVTRFIERPAILESLAGAAQRPDEPEAPTPSVAPTDTGPIPFSEGSTVILDPATLPTPDMQLVANTGPAQGSVFEVGEAGATLGRLPDNSICLTNGRLSRHHAQIDFRDGAYWLTDLGSQNGTLVNDRPLTEPHRLRAGDSIELGTTRLTVILESDD